MPIRKRKCENCGVEIDIKSEREHPAEWARIGHSRYGRKYDRVGIAWWCPDCKDLRDATSVDLPKPVLRALRINRQEKQRLDLRPVAFEIANTLLNLEMILPDIDASVLEATIREILERNLAENGD